MTSELRARERCCIIVPAFREEHRIGDVVKAIREKCPNVIVIDDGSEDGTARCAEEAGAMVIRHPQNKGKGVAFNSGFKYAREKGFDLVITMDADGQHSPTEIPKFIEAYVRTGIPVLVGNRMWDTKDMPQIRWLTNRFMSWMLSRVMGQYVPDTQCGYRLYRCEVIPFVAAESERFAAESEILLHIARRGIRIGDVRIATIYGEEKSKVNPLFDTFRFFSMLLKYRGRMRK